METRFSSGVSGRNIQGPNICRICLTSGSSAGSDGDNFKGMESIFTTVGEYEDRSLYGILVTVCGPLGKKESLKGMPERICRSCKWRLLSAYELYEICLRSDEKIRAVLDTKKQQPAPKNPDQIAIKQEIIDTDEPDYHDDTGGLESSFMLGEHSFMADSTHFGDNSTDLLEEMQMTVDPNETLFEANYKFSEDGTHSCGICGQEFIYKSQCRSHIIVKHDPAKPFKCDVCHITLTTELRLIRHKSMIHGEEEPLDSQAIKEEKDEPTDTIYTCKICSKTFTSVTRFKRHRNVHVVYNRPFKCDICLYRFPNRAQLNQHVKSHLEKPADADGNSEQLEWKCDYCEEKLPVKRALTMHIRRFHPQELQNEAKEKNEYKCIICSEAFARESVLNTHMKMHELLAFEKEKEQRQELELLVKKELQAQLPKTSEGGSTVGTSESSAAAGGPLNSSSSKKKSDADICFVCMICEQEFEKRELLLKHQKQLHSELQLNIVSGGQEDNVANDAEDNPTPSPDKDDESTSESTPKNVEEEDSMVVDVDPSQLLTQTENGQPKRAGPVTLPKCNICQKTFMYNCLLQSHIKKSHSDTKPFECKVCHMRFGYRGTLQKHELTHSAQSIRSGDHGSIMYKCKICSAKFLEMKLLTFHLRTHRNFTIPPEYSTPKKVEIFQCNFCPQIFNVKEKFDEHLSKYHRQNIPPQQQFKPVQLPQVHNHHARKNPDPRKRLAERQPMNEKELFFDKLSIVKIEHVAKPVTMETI